MSCTGVRREASLPPAWHLDLREQGSDPPCHVWWQGRSWTHPGRCLLLFSYQIEQHSCKGEMPVMSSSCHVEGPCSLSGSDSLWCVPAAIKCCCRFLFLFTRGFVVSGHGQSVPAGSQRRCSGSARSGVTACMCGGGPGENTISAAPPPDTSAVLWSFGEHSSLGASPGSSEQWRGHRRERSPCAHSWCVCVSGEHHFVLASLLSPSSSVSHTCWLHHPSTL